MTKKSLSNRVKIQREHFNEIGEKYIKGRSLKNPLVYREVFWRLVFEKLDLFVGKKRKILGLDAMCGNAGESIRLVQRYKNIEIMAFDYSDLMVSSAEENTKMFSQLIKVYRQDILKFHDRNKYDLVIVIGGLHHIPDYIGIVVQNIYNSLKKGGVFLSFEATHNNFLFGKIRDYIYHHNNLFEASSERDFSLKDLNKVFIESRFDIQFQCYPGLLGYTLYYNPDALPRLNRGSKVLVRSLAKLDWWLGMTVIGKYFSFSTCTIAVKK